MSRGFRILFLSAGTIGFVLLVRRIGMADLVADSARLGWMFAAILAAYGVTYLCNAWAWHVVMADEPVRPPFARTCAITVSAFSLDFVTPMVNVGGEPFRIAAATPWLGMRRAMGGVVVYKMLHTLSLFLVWLVALGLAFFFLPHQAGIVATLAIGTVCVAALVVLLFTLHRRGGLESGLSRVVRLPGAGRLRPRFERHRELLRVLDAQVTEFYRKAPRRFYQALGVECLARLVNMLEYYLIFLGVGVDVGYVQGFMIGGLASLILTASFFVPFELGTKEGAHYLLFHLLGLDPALGVYTAIVSRARDLAWIALGLSLIWLSTTPAPQEKRA